MQGGAFHSDVFAIYTHRIMELEEAKARVLMGFPDGHPLTCSDVAEHARFLDVTLEVYKAETGIGILHCARSTGDVDGGFGVRKIHL